ncbi:DNA phosphorothioation-dependent restriction protein DptF, partial [Staphylococcus condimenti]
VIRLLIKIQIENKRMITTRALLNLIHDLIVPEKDDESNNSLLVNLLFESPERSNLLKAVNTQDPALVQNANIDKLNVDLYNSLDFYSKCLELFGEEDYKNIEEYILLFDGLSHERKFKMIVRLHYLLNYKDYESIVYLKYIEALENIEKDKRMIKDLLMKIRKAVESWNGSPENGFIYKDSIDYTSKMRIGIEFKYTLKSIRVTNQLTIEVILNVQGEDYKLVIDYNLYKLLTDIENGYILKEKDKSEAIVFAEFVDKVITSIVSNEKTIMTLTDNNKKYEITEGFLGFEIKEVN